MDKETRELLKRISREFPIPSFTQEQIEHMKYNDPEILEMRRNTARESEEARRHMVQSRAYLSRRAYSGFSRSGLI